MKTKMRILSLFLLMISGILSSAAQSRMFPTLASVQGINSVYVSKAVLNGIGISGINIGGGLEEDIIKSLDSVEVISATTKSASAEAKKTVAQFVDKMKLEVLTDVRDGSDSMVIYGDVVDGVIKLLVLLSNESNECSIIALRGSIPMSSLSKIANM